MKLNCTKLSLNEEGHAEGRPRIRRRSIALALRAAVWSPQSKTYKHFTHPWSAGITTRRHAAELRSEAEEEEEGKLKFHLQQPRTPAQTFANPPPSVKVPVSDADLPLRIPSPATQMEPFTACCFPSPNRISVCIKGFNDFWHIYL